MILTTSVPPTPYSTSSLQAVWILKCRALTLRDWVDDTDTVEEEGVGDILLDDNVIETVVTDERGDFAILFDYIKLFLARRKWVYKYNIYFF